MSYEAWGDGDDGPDWRDAALDHGWIDPVDVSQAMLDVMRERDRQQDVEGWSPEHDDQHVDGELAAAAACYLRWGKEGAARSGEPPPADWPFEPEWWKPTGDRRDIVRGLALGLAELERLDRAAKREGAA